MSKLGNFLSIHSSNQPIYHSSDKWKEALLGTLVISGCVIGGLAFWKYTRGRDVNKRKNAVVIITGCDTGLGYSLALHYYELGFCVFAGVLNLQIDGANSLETLRTDLGRINVFKLDVTNADDITKSLEIVSEFLDNNSEHYIHAIVNNAGVMVFGEFEWQSNELIHQQLNVNLLGTMNFTKSYLPLLRKYKGRIINVSSHCALSGLPGLSVYAATKAGLQAWNDAIRVEYVKYGIKVVSIMPGSFFNQSNILLKQSLNADKMKSAMSEEALQFYGDYFNQYQQYISGFSKDMSLHRIQDENLYQIFTDALTSEKPCSLYINSSFRYSVYHFLFRFCPITIRDYLVDSFVNMPTYKK